MYVFSTRSKENDLIVQCHCLGGGEGEEKQENGSAEILLLWKVYDYSTSYFWDPLHSLDLFIKIFLFVCFYITVPYC